MKITLGPRSLFYGSTSLLIAILAIVAAAAQNSNNGTLMATAEHELKRAHADLEKLDPAPYFISYTIRDQSSALVIASQGSLINSTQVQTRTADVVTRVGGPALDNTHGENRHSRRCVRGTCRRTTMQTPSHMPYGT